MNAIIKHGERASEKKNALLDNFLSQASRETSKSIYHVVCDLKNMLDFISTYFWNHFLRYRIFRSKKVCLRLQQKIVRNKHRQMMNATFFYVRISRFQFPPWGIRQRDGKNHFFSIRNFDDISSGLLKMINGWNIELSLRLNCHLFLLPCNVMIIDNFLAKICHQKRSLKKHFRSLLH